MQRHTAVNMDVLAQEVSRRLCALDDATVLDDPHSHVLRIATEVETEWEGRARRSRVDRSMDAIPAPSASASDAIRAAVLALPQRQRDLMLLHVDGLDYRQIAKKVRATNAEVLRELAKAYCRLRRTMPEPAAPGVGESVRPPPLQSP
jgi:DNA-directed RNA polymerase specialized sigma24 family protein